MDNPNQNQTDIFGNVVSFNNPVHSAVEPQNMYNQSQVQNVQDNDDIQIIDVPVQSMPEFNPVIEPQVIQPIVNEYVEPQLVEQVQQVQPQMVQSIVSNEIQTQKVEPSIYTGNYVSSINPVPVQPGTTVVEQGMPQMNIYQDVPMNESATAESVNPVPVETVPIIDILQEEQVEPQNQSFNEMAFAGVNQQQEEVKRVTILESQPTVMNVDEQVERSSNMEPIQKQEDENSGLKFLLVLGIIFAVVIILLPYL